MDFKVGTSDSSLLVAGMDSMTITDETSQMFSVHSAICHTCCDVQQLSAACDDDYEIIKAAVAANRDWTSMLDRRFSNCALDKCVGSSVPSRAAAYIETPDKKDFLMEQHPLNITECVTSAVNSVCKTRKCVVHDTALKLSYEAPSLPCEDAMNVMHHMLRGIRNMCARDEIRRNLIQKGAHVIFVNYIWSILDMCVNDETESKSSVSITLLLLLVVIILMIIPITSLMSNFVKCSSKLAGA